MNRRDAEARGSINARRLVAREKRRSPVSAGG